MTDESDFEFWGHWSETVRLHCTVCYEDLLDDMEMDHPMTLADVLEAVRIHNHG